MLRMPKPRNNQSWKIGTGFTHIDPKYDPQQTYIIGRVYSVHGIVYFYTSASPKHPVTEMNFTYNGKFYRRVWEKTFPQRTISTIAKRFIKEIVESDGVK